MSSPPLFLLPVPSVNLLASFRDAHGRILLYDYLERLPKEVKENLSNFNPLHSTPDTGVTIGILGAGAAGLYAALLFDWLNSHDDTIHFTYEIFEAESERVGGRLYTHHFNPGKMYDYYASVLT